MALPPRGAGGRPPAYGAGNVRRAYHRICYRGASDPGGSCGGRNPGPPHGGPDTVTVRRRAASALGVPARPAVTAAVLIDERAAAVRADAGERQERLLDLSGTGRILPQRLLELDRERGYLPGVTVAVPVAELRLRQPVRHGKRRVRAESEAVQGAADRQRDALRDRGHAHHGAVRRSVDRHFAGLHAPQLLDDIPRVRAGAQRERREPPDRVGLEVERLHKYLAQASRILVDGHVDPAARRF